MFHFSFDLRRQSVSQSVNIFVVFHSFIHSTFEFGVSPVCERLRVRTLNPNLSFRQHSQSLASKRLSCCIVSYRRKENPMNKNKPPKKNDSNALASHGVNSSSHVERNRNRRDGSFVVVIVVVRSSSFFSL